LQKVSKKIGRFAVKNAFKQIGHFAAEKRFQKIFGYYFLKQFVKKTLAEGSTPCEGAGI